MCSVAVNLSKFANWFLVRRRARSRTSIVEHEAFWTAGGLVSMSGGDQEVWASATGRSASERALGRGTVEVSGEFLDAPAVSSSLRFAATAAGSEGKSSTNFCHVFLASSVFPWAK